jgi:hypothetical protein
MMKRNLVIRAAILAAILLAACSPAGVVKTPAATAADVAPQTSFASPAAGQTIPAGKTTVVAQSTAAGGVARIELQINGIVVATGENPDPAQSYFVLVYDWQPPAGGDYKLEARAQSKGGVWGALTALTVNVTAPAIESTPAPTEQVADTPAPVEPTNTPLPTSTSVVGPGPSPTPQPIAPPALTPTDSGVSVKVQIFGTRLYKADTNCDPQTQLFTAITSDPGRTAGIYMAFRIHDPNSADHRGWTKGAPMNIGANGKFFIYITTRYIWKPIPWIPANVDYQFYALDHDGNVLWLSQIYRDMQILQCNK